MMSSTPTQLLVRKKITAVFADARAVRKYPTLSTTFLQGSFIGQIKSVYQTRETNPQKVTDFKLALANGDCTWDLLPLSKSLIAKLQTLGIEVPATAD
jgi:hypothetical protein